MSETTERLRRLVAEEVGECRDADLDDRLARLDALVDGLPDEDRLAADAHALAALGGETRHRIVRLLVAADDDLCSCEFDPLLDVSQSGRSHALADLREAGLVERRKDGRWRYYRPTERAEALVAVLDRTADGEDVDGRRGRR